MNIILFTRLLAFVTMFVAFLVAIWTLFIIEYPIQAFLVIPYLLYALFCLYYLKLSTKR